MWMKAQFMKKLPITICGQSFSLETHIVNNDLPLLLSRDSLKKAKCVIDLENDKIWIGDRQQDLIVSESGHVFIAIGRYEDSIKENDVVTLFTEDPLKCADHLHRYFAHASAKRIGEVVMNSDLKEKNKIVKV